MILCCDPGSLNTGWALLSSAGKVKYTSHDKRPGDVEPLKAIDYYTTSLKHKILASRHVTDFIIEMYYPFGGGRANAHSQILLVGALIGVASKMGCRVVSLDPKEWKDWAKKNDKYHVDRSLTQHEIDAVTMGKYYLEVVNDS